MRYHANAALTMTQRALVRELAEQGVSHAELARRCGVHRRTSGRWVGRNELTDRSSAPKTHGRRVITEAYRRAVIAARTAHPEYGPKRLAHALRMDVPSANVATVWRILKAAHIRKDSSVR